MIFGFKKYIRYSGMAKKALMNFLESSSPRITEQISILELKMAKITEL